jgi:hypothetical protein
VQMTYLKHEPDCRKGDAEIECRKNEVIPVCDLAQPNR